MQMRPLQSGAGERQNPNPEGRSLPLASAPPPQRQLKGSGLEAVASRQMVGV